MFLKISQNSQENKTNDYILYEMQQWAKWVNTSVTAIWSNQPAITGSKLTTETLEQGVKYVQS